jgi:hypothetical protein
MRWGLVPYWAKDQAIGNKMINARSETPFLLRKGKPLPSLAAVPDRNLGGGSTACRTRNAIGDFAPAPVISRLFPLHPIFPRLKRLENKHSAAGDFPL